jgi:hypothetical protein
MTAQKFKDNYVKDHQCYITDFFTSSRFHILHVKKSWVDKFWDLRYYKKDFSTKFVSQ